MVWFWLIVAAIALLIEVLTTSMVSIWFCGAALICAVLALLGLPQVTQILAFIAGSLVLFGAAKNWMAEHFHGEKSLTNLDLLIGKIGKVTQTIRPYEGGRVEVDGMDWKAICPDDHETIEIGSSVKIVGITGVKLEVIAVHDFSEYQED